MTDQSKETELKPCPFCGGEATPCPPTEVEFGNWIRCKSCGVENHGPDAHETREVAITAWNRRST